MPQKLTRRMRICLGAVSILISVLLGLGALKLYSELCFFLSMPGGMIFVLLIGGPHGGGNKLLDAFAAIPAALINAAMWYFVLSWIVRHWRERGESTSMDLNK